MIVHDELPAIVPKFINFRKIELKVSNQIIQLSDRSGHIIAMKPQPLFHGNFVVCPYIPTRFPGDIRYQRQHRVIESQPFAILVILEINPAIWSEYFHFSRLSNANRRSVLLRQAQQQTSHGNCLGQATQERLARRMNQIQRGVLLQFDLVVPSQNFLVCRTVRQTRLKFRHYQIAL
ncbi:hypothetical protein DBV33_15210 [Pseudomonas fluorescens]|nr:hypothetical protein DBV33_15210 [Pseudomonas fluorescens]